MSTAVQVREQASPSERYAERVNPAWVRLLSLLEMNVRYERCVGAELYTSDGKRILDFLSGYCVHNVGHNHPAVIAALREELEREGLAMGFRFVAAGPLVRSSYKAGEFFVQRWVGNGA